MDTKTLEALNASIAKWEVNVETARVSLRDGSTIIEGDCAKEGVIGMGEKGCPLCILFIEQGCLGCPVSQKTGREFCCGTPFRSVENVLEGLSPSGSSFVADDAFVSACEAEVAFLRSLLPAEA